MITTLPILSILIWLPIFMGTILTLVPCNNKQRYYGIITTAITLLFAAYLWQGFDNSVATMQYIEQHSWLPNLGI
ncbi:MAG: NADH-quinone oxidoreductase subunit M, partial [Legionellales bacterium]